MGIKKAKIAIDFLAPTAGLEPATLPTESRDALTN